MPDKSEKYLELVEELNNLKFRMESFIGDINSLKQKLYQHHKSVTELNERNSVDEGEKSCKHVWPNTIGVCICVKCGKFRTDED